MIPKDPHILLGYINLKLRDNYPSLEALCDDLEVDGNEIRNKLESIGYRYCPDKNQFQS